MQSKVIGKLVPCFSFVKRGRDFDYSGTFHLGSPASIGNFLNILGRETQLMPGIGIIEQSGLIASEFKSEESSINHYLNPR